MKRSAVKRLAVNEVVDETSMHLLRPIIMAFRSGMATGGD